MTYDDIGEREIEERNVGVGVTNEVVDDIDEIMIVVVSDPD